MLIDRVSLHVYRDIVSLKINDTEPYPYPKTSNSISRLSYLLSSILVFCSGLTTGDVAWDVDGSGVCGSPAEVDGCGDGGQ